MRKTIRLIQCQKSEMSPFLVLDKLRNKALNRAFCLIIASEASL